MLVAKLSMGALAQGERVVRRLDAQSLEPRAQGSSGSSAGPGSATAAGLVGFSIGTETLRLDHLAVIDQRRRRPAADLRTRQPLRRDGPELDDGQDRPDVPRR